MTSSIDKEHISNVACPCCSKNDSTFWMRVPDRSTPWTHVPDQLRSGADFYDLRRCSSCLHVWLANRPTPAEMNRYYGEEYHRAVGSSGEISPRRWTAQLQVISRYKSKGNILDIGCSSGGFLACLKAGPWGLYGVEASQDAAERARALTGADVFAGDVIDANFPSGSFDVITCSDVLEHLYEPREVLRRVYDWLKPEGIFYVFVPNIRSWEARMFGSYWCALDLPRHLHHFSSTSLADLAMSVNLRQVRMVTPPGSYLEHSTSILVDDLLRRVGVKRTVPVNLTSDTGIAWRVVRKGLRLSVEALYGRIASYCGAAPSIQAVFRKCDGFDATKAKKGATKLVRAKCTQIVDSKGLGKVARNAEQRELPSA